MHHHALLETHLKQLRLPTFLAHYQQIARDAARTDLPYERFLLALCQAELAQREARRVGDPGAGGGRSSERTSRIA